MKESHKPGHYSIISNICFLLHEMTRHYKSTPVMLPVSVIAYVMQYSIMVIIPSRAVYIFENKLSARDFITQIGGIILLYTIVRIIWLSSQNCYINSASMVRCYYFIPELIEKSLVTDYCNRENNSCHKLNGLATMAISGNYNGIERVLIELPLLARNLAGMLLFGGAIVTVDYKILLVLLAMLIFNISANKYAHKYLEKHREEDSEIHRKTNLLRSRTSNVVCGKDIRMYKMESLFSDILEFYALSGKKWQKGLEKRFFLPVASDTVFTAIRDGLAYFILISKALHGDITLSGFTLMLGVISNFSEWMFGFTDSIIHLAEANKQVCDYRTVIDMQDTFKHGTGVKVTENMLKQPPVIEFQDVSFRYGNDDRDILSHINLKIKPGEKIALVGGNGSGKTTLVKLLCGFYHPSGGRILVNGTDIEEYDIDEYFKLAGVVFQDLELLPFRIVNIVSGQEKENTDIDKLWDALSRAGIADKIKSLPDREDTYISNIFDENGIQFSGGETQKLMLAACIYKNAPLMILDEPTAALDPIAESALYKEYNNITENKTSIFISHRLASTRFCDHILFLENGKIMEEGSHAGLLKQNGRYARIYKIQSHYYEEGAEKDLHGMEEAYGQCK
ncbi:MAG: ABC transporter ATP-binding protein [Lachnospiraceae bacterium]|nr:ABC transporter ATP-binding protein [Lachnospiraceae bacterium]